MHDAVDLARTENTGWADGTPDDGGDVEDLTTWAGVGVLLVVGADIGDVGHGPVVDCDLADGRPEDCDALSEPHGLGWDLHVVTHLQVLEEVQSLGHGDVTVSLEHHHGQRATWKHVSWDMLTNLRLVDCWGLLTNDELSNDVETNLPVGDSLNHTNWDQEDDWNEHADDECPPGHVCIPDQAGGEGESKENDVESSIPPLWRVGILTHHLQVDIGILVASQLITLPDLRTVVKRGVDNEGGDGRERHTIADGKVGRKEQRAVALVFSNVQSQVFVHDARDVVTSTSVVPGVRILHWEVLGPESTSVLNTDGSEEEEDDDTSNHVCNSKEWVDEWGGQETGYDGPVKGDWNQTKTSNTTEELVDNRVLWSDPAGKGEITEELSDPSWEEVPDERSGEDVKKPSVTSDGPAVGLGWVRDRVVVESVEHGGVDQGGWPDHGSGPDEETADETGHSKSNLLRSDNE